MAIILKNSWNVPPVRWGSFADVRYAIKVNAEKIYGIDFNDIASVYPFFWGLPLIDFANTKISFSNDTVFYKDNVLAFDGTNSFLHSISNQISDSDTQYTIYIKLRLKGPGILAARRSHTNNNAILYQLYTDGAEIKFITRNNTGGNIALAIGSTNYEVGKTFDICGIRNANNIYVYYNGVQEGSDNDSGGAITTTRTSIGAYYGGGSWRDNIEGLVYDFRVLKIPLTPDQALKFNALPYGLYQKIVRPFYLLPIVSGPFTVLNDLNTEISGGSEYIQDLITDIEAIAEDFFDLDTEISATTVQTILDLDTEIAAVFNVSFKDLNTDIQTTAESFADLNTEITASSDSVFFDLNTEIVTSALSLYDLNTEVITNAQTISDLNTEIQARGDTFYDLTTDIRAVAGSELLFYDLNTEISSVRSKYWLDTEIEALSYAKWSFRTEWNPNRFLSTEIAAKKPYYFSFKTQTGSSYAAATSEIEILLSGYTWPLRTLFLDYLRVGTSNVYNFELWWARGQSGKNSLKNAKIKAEYTTTQSAGGYEVVTCDWLTCRVNGGVEQTINETFSDLGNMPCDSKLDIELTVDCRDCSISRGLIFFKLIIVGDSKEAIYGVPLVYGEGTQYFEGEYDNYTADNFICRLYVV